MRAVITVVGHDTVGIIAGVSDILSQSRVNILDITQSVLSDLFAMIMLVDLSTSTISLSGLSERLDEVGSQKGVKIHLMREDVFDAMHKI